jgi:hypothetical protein
MSRICGCACVVRTRSKNSLANFRGSFHLAEIETSLILRAIFVATLDLSGERLLVTNSNKERILDEHEDREVTATYITRDGPKVDPQALSLFEDSFVTVLVGHVQVTKQVTMRSGLVKTSSSRRAQAPSLLRASKSSPGARSRNDASPESGSRCLACRVVAGRRDRQKGETDAVALTSSVIGGGR